MASWRRPYEWYHLGTSPHPEAFTSRRNLIMKFLLLWGAFACFPLSEKDKWRLRLCGRDRRRWEDSALGDGVLVEFIGEGNVSWRIRLPNINGGWTRSQNHWPEAVTEGMLINMRIVERIENRPLEYSPDSRKKAGLGQACWNLEME